LGDAKQRTNPKMEISTKNKIEITNCNFFEKSKMERNKTRKKQEKNAVYFFSLFFSRNLHFRICALLRIAQIQKWRWLYIFCMFFTCSVLCFLYVFYPRFYVFCRTKQEKYQIKNKKNV